MATFSEEWFDKNVKGKGRSYVEDGRRIDSGPPPGIKTAKTEPKPRNAGVLTTEIQQPRRAVPDLCELAGTRKRNQTEERFERTFLIPAKLDGKLLDYKFERVTLVLGNNTRYTPDFFGRWENGVLQFWEIKGGHIREDARVKYYSAVEQYPEFAFQLVQWDRGEWRTIHAARCEPIC